MNQANFISFSGGKDSTAMLLMMLERGESIADIVFFDTGWEFPEMYEHLERVEQFTGRKITRLQSPNSFYHLLLDKETFYRSGLQKGELKKVGYGWPTAYVRWCTGEKIRALNGYSRGQSYCQHMGIIYYCVGFSLDECQRAESDNQIRLRKRGNLKRYPLFEYGATGSQAMEYCRERGFDWGGLYDLFGRVSCFCCPLKSLEELRRLREHRPELWKKMLQWEAKMPTEKHKRFKGESTVSQLDARFAEEARFQTFTLDKAVGE